MTNETGSESSPLAKSHRAMYECSRAFEQALDEQQMLERVCEIFVEVCGFRTVWFDYPEPDAANATGPTTQAGAPEGLAVHPARAIFARTTIFFLYQLNRTNGCLVCLRFVPATPLNLIPILLKRWTYFPITWHVNLRDYAPSGGARKRRKHSHNVKVDFGS